MFLDLKTETFGVEDQSWLGSEHGTSSARTITLDTSAFTANVHYPNGYFLSGIPLGRITASGMYGPYVSNSNEVQTLTISATGGTFTITVDGETTASITYSAGLTAATIQTALMLLSSVNPGDITVSGSAGGPYTFTFGGRYAGQDVPAIVATQGSLTGGAGTAVVATGTPGGPATSVGQEVLAGFLFTTVTAPSVNTIDVVAAIYEHGRVVESRLPIAVDAAGKAAVKGQIIFQP